MPEPACGANEVWGAGCCERRQYLKSGVTLRSNSAPPTNLRRGLSMQMTRLSQLCSQLAARN